MMQVTELECVSRDDEASKTTHEMRSATKPNMLNSTWRASSD